MQFQIHHLSYTTSCRQSSSKYNWTHGIRNLFKLYEFSNYKSSDYFGQVLKKINKAVSSRCRVLYRLRKSNIYKFYLSETFISFSITILLKFTEIWKSEYCFLKKSLIEDRFILSSLFWFILFETFWSKGSRSKSFVNSANLLRILIASSTSFRDGGDMGSSGISSLSLLPPSTVSTGVESIR